MAIWKHGTITLAIVEASTVQLFVGGAVPSYSHGRLAPLALHFMIHRVLILMFQARGFVDFLMW